MGTNPENTTKDYRSALIARAKTVNFRQILPKVPKKKTPSTLSGYNKRMSNWERQLKVAESY